MLDLVAKKLFLTKGVGVADDKLTSFEFALRNAGISGTNIVLISSIFPPRAKLLPRKDNYPLQLPYHAAYHTALLKSVSEKAFSMLPEKMFQKPIIPLIDGRGYIMDDRG